MSTQLDHLPEDHSFAEAYGWDFRASRGEIREIVPKRTTSCRNPGLPPSEWIRSSEAGADGLDDAVTHDRIYVMKIEDWFVKASDVINARLCQPCDRLI